MEIVGAGRRKWCKVSLDFNDGDLADLVVELSTSHRLHNKRFSSQAFTRDAIGYNNPLINFFTLILCAEHFTPAFLSVSHPALHFTG